MFRRISNWFELFALVAFALFVVLLFTNKPTAPAAAPPAVVAASNGIDGAALYGANCASCHGGDGSGGLGPRLAGQVVEDFPVAADQEAFVAEGRRPMPAFGKRLSPDEIAAIVAYTRTVLGS